MEVFRIRKVDYSVEVNLPSHTIFQDKKLFTKRKTFARTFAKYKNNAAAQRSVRRHCFVVVQFVDIQFEAVLQEQCYFLLLRSRVSLITSSATFFGQGK